MKKLLEALLQVCNTSTKKNMRKKGYSTGWQYDDETYTKSHRIYYNDEDIMTGNLLYDGKIVGNVKMRNPFMEHIDNKNNYMW